MRALAENLAGKTFGRLTVLERAKNDSRGKTRWKCLCECGKETIVMADSLKSGHTQSCGCMAAEKAGAAISKVNTTHGDRYTRLYRVWAHMKERCFNPNSISYENYGGRGITVCAEWKQDFVAFRDWAMENGYSDELQIDRIDNDGNYCPENCRWSTRKEQSLNRRSNVFLTFNGKRQTVREWAIEIGISPKVLYDRIKSGWPIERVLSERKKGTKDG